MKRRDFVKLTAAGVAMLALPVALTAPALGTGWRNFYITTYFGKLPTEAEVASHNLFVIARHMKDKGFTEITGYSHEITRQPDRFPPFSWVVEAQAKLR